MRFSNYITSMAALIGAALLGITPAAAAISITGTTNPGASPTLPTRVFMDTPRATCASPQTYPGPSPITGPFSYQTYAVKNGPVAGCATITFTPNPTTCTGSTAYTGVVAFTNAFDPNNLATGYLADTSFNLGSGFFETFEINLAANQEINLVVIQASGNGTATPCTYTITSSELSLVEAPPEPYAAVPVPTLTEWAMILLFLSLAGVGIVMVRRRGAM